MPTEPIQLGTLAPAPTPPPARSTAARTFLFIGDVLLNAVTVVGLVLVIRYALVAPFEVKGESMEPNFHSNDLLIVDKLSYRFQEPQRGDVIVLIPPSDTSQFYVKCVVGLPGEAIQFLNGKVVLYSAEHPDGTTLSEEYIPSTITTYGTSTERITIPADSYFALGDNREHSNDSRNWGVLPRANIVGRAWVVLWPPTDMQVVKHPGFAL